MLKKAIVRNIADFVKIVHGKAKVSILHAPDEKIENKTTRFITLRKTTSSEAHSTNTFKPLKSHYLLQTIPTTRFIQTVCVSLNK